MEKEKEEKRSFLNKVPGFRSGKTWKKVVASVGYLFIVFFVFGLVAGEDTNQTAPPSSAVQEQQSDKAQNDEQPVATDAKAKEEAFDDEQLKAAILSFEEEIYRTEKIASAAMEDYAAKANALAEGGATIYDVYSAASYAKDKCKAVQYDLFRLEVPEAPKEISELLRGAKSELSTAYMVKAEALDSAMKFLDDQKPSHLQNFKDKIANADKFIINGSLKLLEAKKKAGIEIVENLE